VDYNKQFCLSKVRNVSLHVRCIAALTPYAVLYHFIYSAACVLLPVNAKELVKPPYGPYFSAHELQ